MKSFGKAIFDDNSFPGVQWNVLPEEDRDEFLSLRDKFYDGYLKDNYQDILTELYKFNFRNPEYVEERSVISGISFCGPYILINFRQLKNVICRYKCSIQIGLNALGYVVEPNLATKYFAIKTSMPTVTNDPILAEKWDIYVCDSDAGFCFLTRFEGIKFPTENEEPKPATTTNPSVQYSKDLLNKPQFINETRFKKLAPPPKSPLPPNVFNLVPDKLPHERVNEQEIEEEDTNDVFGSNSDSDVLSLEERLDNLNFDIDNETKQYDLLTDLKLSKRFHVMTPFDDPSVSQPYMDMVKASIPPQSEQTLIFNDIDEKSYDHDDFAEQIGNTGDNEVRDVFNLDDFLEDPDEI